MRHKFIINTGIQMYYFLVLDVIPINTAINNAIITVFNLSIGNIIENTMWNIPDNMAISRLISVCFFIKKL